MNRHLKMIATLLIAWLIIAMLSSIYPALIAAQFGALIIVAIYIISAPIIFSNKNKDAE